MEEIRKIIVEFAEGSKKSKFYFNDMEKAVKEKMPDAKTRDIKKAATSLVNEEKLIFFSTGSTTMYGLKGRGQTEDY
jgi:DeoR/GlpR family transcriptional regulator of sugar metabolism